MKNLFVSAFLFACSNLVFADCFKGLDLGYSTFASDEYRILDSIQTNSNIYLTNGQQVFAYDVSQTKTCSETNATYVKLLQPNKHNFTNATFATIQNSAITLRWEVQSIPAPVLNCLNVFQPKLLNAQDARTVLLNTILKGIPLKDELAKTLHSKMISAKRRGLEPLQVVHDYVLSLKKTLNECTKIDDVQVSTKATQALQDLQLFIQD